jgi:hypothetical protein
MKGSQIKPCFAGMRERDSFPCGKDKRKRVK